MNSLKMIVFNGKYKKISLPLYMYVNMYKSNMTLNCHKYTYVVHAYIIYLCILIIQNYTLNFAILTPQVKDR